MATADHDLSHLLALVEAARAEAGRLGAAAGSVPETLARAADEVRARLAEGGRPDEGIRPEDLTTDNDK